MDDDSEYTKQGFSVRLFAIGMPSGKYCASYNISIAVDGWCRLLVDDNFFEIEFENKSDAMRDGARRADGWIAHQRM